MSELILAYASNMLYTYQLCPGTCPASYTFLTFGGVESFSSLIFFFFANLTEIERVNKVSCVGLRGSS